MSPELLEGLAMGLIIGWTICIWIYIIVGSGDDDGSHW
jgi:hypothetical protein